MRIVASVLVLWGLSACALTTDYIDVPYHGAANLAVVPGAFAAKVVVTPTDGRTAYRDRVSVKKNGYGIEMATIAARNDIPQTVGRAIEQELSSLGFTLGPGGAEIVVEVVRFYNDFKMGFFVGDAVAEVILNVKVLGPGKKLTFSKHYEGIGIEKDTIVAAGDNARLALIAALRNTVFTVINDVDLQSAILTAQKLPATAAGSIPTF